MMAAARSQDLSNPPLRRAILYVMAERSQSVKWCIINPSMRKSIFVAALPFTITLCNANAASKGSIP